MQDSQMPSATARTCPAWCQAIHEEPDDDHSVSRSVITAAHEFEVTGQVWPETVDVTVLAAPNGGDVHLELTVPVDAFGDAGPVETTRRLSLAEAAELAAALTELTAAAAA